MSPSNPLGPGEVKVAGGEDGEGRMADSEIVQQPTIFHGILTLIWDILG